MAWTLATSRSRSMLPWIDITTSLFEACHQESSRRHPRSEGTYLSEGATTGVSSW